MKKKIISIFALVALIVGMFSTTVFAGDYDGCLSIGDVQITESGDVAHNDVFTEGTINVQFSGTGADKHVVITLTDVKLASPSDYDSSLIECYISSEIVLIGNNEFTLNDGSYNNSISVWSDGGYHKISGTGSLSICTEGESNWGLYYYGYLEIADTVNISITTAHGRCLYVSADSIPQEYGVFFNLQDGGKVSLTCNDEDYYPIYLNGCDSFNFADGIAVVSPAGAKLDDTNTYLVDADGNTVYTVVIEKAAEPTGVPTGDSNNIVLFSFLGILAIAVAGFAIKKRLN